MKNRAFFAIVVIGLVLHGWAGVGLCANGEPVTQLEYAAALGMKFSEAGVLPWDGVDINVLFLNLAGAGIEPPGGWNPEAPMTPEAISDITDDVIVAAREGKIACDPQRGVDLVAATTTELGIGGEPVYTAAYDRLGYYFPPSVPSGGGGGSIVLSLSE